MPHVDPTDAMVFARNDGAPHTSQEAITNIVAERPISGSGAIDPYHLRLTPKAATAAPTMRMTLKGVHADGSKPPRAVQKPRPSSVQGW